MFPTIKTVNNARGKNDKNREYLEERAARASKAKFLDILAKVPDIEPEEYDRI